ncbi:MAG: hypothetical protein GC162_08270 [Planctomycetes bacterium]|nr:hypothetical protein [Planctomycetota bacterium]
MTHAPIQPDDFAGLCAAYCEDRFDAPACAAFERRLITDPAALDAFLRYMDIHASLSLWSDQTLRLRAGSLRPSSGQAASAWRAVEDVSTEATPTLSRASRRSVWYASAALLAIAAALFFVFLPTAPHSPLPTPHSAAPAAYAILSDVSDDAQFADGDRALGSDLTGPIKLTAGRAQLMFQSTAVVDLTGPCRFEMTGSNAGRLTQGVIHAHIHDRAHGFTVEAPHDVRVIDLGTEYVMRVDDDAAGRVYIQMVAGRARVETRSQVRFITAGQFVVVNDAAIDDATAGQIRLAGISPALGRRIRFFESFDAPLQTSDFGPLHWVSETMDHWRLLAADLSATALADVSPRALEGRAASLVIPMEHSIGPADRSVYLSFLMRTAPGRTAQGLGPFRVISLCDGGDDDVHRRYAIGLLRNDGDTHSTRFEHRAYALSAAQTPDLGPAGAGTQLFVVHLQWAGDRSMTIDAWLNPDGAVDFTAASHRITLPSGAFRFDRLKISSVADEGLDATPTLFDEIRVADDPPRLLPRAAASPASDRP